MNIEEIRNDIMDFLGCYDSKIVKNRLAGIHKSFDIRDRV